jgi:hypothetical protein
MGKSTKVPEDNPCPGNSNTANRTGMDFAHDAISWTVIVSADSQIPGIKMTKGLVDVVLLCSKTSTFIQEREVVDVRCLSKVVGITNRDVAGTKVGSEEKAKGAVAMAFRSRLDRSSSPSSSCVDVQFMPGWWWWWWWWNIE